MLKALKLNARYFSSKPIKINKAALNNNLSQILIDFSKEKSQLLLVNQKLISSEGVDIINENLDINNNSNAKYKICTDNMNRVNIINTKINTIYTVLHYFRNLDK